MGSLITIYEGGKKSLIQAFDPQKIIVGDNSSLERDPFAPTYELLHFGGIGAQPTALTDEILDFIDEVTYEDNADQFDKLTIRFTSQMDNKGGGKVLSLIDNVLFAEGSMFAVKFGYGKSLITVGACDIVRKEPDFPENSFPSFTITGYDAMQRMARNRPVGGDSYKNENITDIVKRIGQRNGLVVDAVGLNGQPTIEQISSVWKGDAQKVGVSDYEFLKKIADSRSLDLFVKYDDEIRKHVLFMQKPSNIKQKEVFTFVYNENDVSYHRTLLSFQPQLDVYDQGSDIEIFLLGNQKQRTGVKHDFIKKLTVEEQEKIKSQKERRFTGGNKTSAKQEPAINGAIVGFKAFGRSFRFPEHKRFKSEEEITNEIEKFIARQKAHFITGNARTIGVEALQSRQTHIFAGVSDQFSGKYYIDKVVHKFSLSEGYKCDLSVHRVIEDEVVQAPPTLEFSDSDKTIQKFKKYVGKK